MLRFVAVMIGFGLSCIRDIHLMIKEGRFKR